MGWWFMWHYWELIPYLQLSLATPFNNSLGDEMAWSIDIDFGWLFLSYSRKWEFGG